MRQLFTFLSLQILGNVPAIKTVRPWNNQLRYSNDPNIRTEKAFRYPACFIEFIVNETKNFSIGVKNVDVTIRFRFALESYKFIRLDDLDFAENFDLYVERLRGSESDIVQFSSLQEVQTEYDEDFDNVDKIYVDYKTTWRKLSGFGRNRKVLVAPVAPKVTAIVKGGKKIYTTHETKRTFVRSTAELPVTFILDDETV